MVLRLKERRFVCSNFPECNAVHHTHPDGSPLGIPGDEQTRKLRQEAHAKLNQMWSYRTRGGRAQMYAWLKENSKSGHIAMMGKDELINLIRKIPVRRIVRNSLWEQIKQPI